MKQEQDLFGWQREQILQQQAPLAARMRPQTLDEFAGQGHIIGHGRLLRRAIQADQLSSLIFYGPPGTGKTTLARIIANTTRAYFCALNAVLAGVKDLRAAVQEAQTRQGEHSQRTILFVDEVHRFNKAQQDALLPWVENGTVILIGATTENPYFEVNKALVSRSRIFQLQPLQADDLKVIARYALEHPSRGYGKRTVDLQDDALEHLVNVANGDARALLNALELAVETTPPHEDDGSIVITLPVAEESIQRRAVLYDKEGDAHFDTISAFIKSVRGSDPDAALYWLAKMDYAGEDPRFIFRRLLILASEDIGLADPHAIVVTQACAATFDRVGMPEGRFHLAHATLYLSTTAKSNTTLGYFDALKAVQHEREGEVPNHLKDASRDKKSFGHGAGYLYPHSFRDHWVAQQYLPQSLQGQVFYQPSDQGWEAEVQATVTRRREAQIAAITEGISGLHGETLTYGPKDRHAERWLQRTLGQSGERIALLRERIFDLAQLQRHHVVLDLNAASGLLTWEALRHVPEGGVTTCAFSPQHASSLSQQSKQLPHLLQPSVLSTSIQTLQQTLHDHNPDLRFDCILGRNTLTHSLDKSTHALHIASLLQKDGRIVLAETIPRHAQRICALAQPTWLPEGLYQTWQEAENSLYQDPSDPLIGWDAQDLQDAFNQHGFQVTLSTETHHTALTITESLLQRWFDPAKPNSYAQRLQLPQADLKHIQDALTTHLLHQTIPWQSTTAILLVQP